MISQLQKHLTKNKLDAFLVTKPENVFYLTGFRGSFGQVFLTHHDCYLITDFRYFLRAKKELTEMKNLPKIEIIGVEEAMKIIPKHKKIGFEEDHITVLRLKKFKKIYTKVQFKGFSSIIENMRKIKSEDEIKFIKKAASIGDTVLKNLIPTLKIGQTEKELVWSIKTLIKEHGGEGVSFPPIVAFGKNSAIPHHESTNKALRKGDMILFDFGVKYKGYCSDMTRMVFTHQPTNKEKKIYEIVLEAQKKALKAVKPGEYISKLDDIARDYIASHKYGKNFGHALGHGVGIEVHEDPTVAGKNKEKLEEGMVITIEPGIYVPTLGGVRIEDLVVVRKDGPEIFSRSSKKILMCCL